MSPRGRTAIALAGAVALGWSGACSDNPAGPVFPPPPPTVGVVVSDPATPSFATARVGGTAAVATDGEDVAYASLLPETAPAGVIASVRAAASGSLVWTTVTDGGFNPVAITAAVDDTIDVVVRDASGATVHVVRVPVAAVRAPVIVRGNPPPKKRDVPLNTSIVIVFSEPIAPSSLTSSSIRLYRGASRVAGSLSLLPGSGAEVAFRPSAPLKSNTDYSLVVTGAVRDLQGSVLGSGATIAFRTGQDLSGPPASIGLAPDTVHMIGATYQMTATVRDTAGNILIDQPITWATSDPTGLAVSQTGLLTALGGGYYQVTASVNGLTAGASVDFTAGPPASLAVSPTPATVAAGDTMTLTATVRDAAGRLVYAPQVTWTSSDSGVAIATASGAGGSGVTFGTVTGVSPGDATIAATAGIASGTVGVTVTPPHPVASVTVTPASATVQVQGTTQLSATLRDATGHPLTGRVITWSTQDSAVATVDANGLVTGVGPGSTTVTATSEGVSGTAVISLPPVASLTVSPSSPTLVREASTTLLATVRDADGTQLLGRRVTWITSDPSVATVDSVGPFVWLKAVAPGSVTVTATSEGVSGTASVAVVTLTFVSLSAGGAHTCGIVTGGAAYCWGSAQHDQLGTGTGQTLCGFGGPCSPWPLGVAGGLAFVSLDAGGDHTCGTTTTGAAYCWGWNEWGGVGDGTSGNVRPTPTPVAGGPSFVSIAAGYYHSCGLTATGAAYCWGGNFYGMLGDSSFSTHTMPVPVAGGLSFTTVAPSIDHSCALTAGGMAYCWGNNFYGQLGDTARFDHNTPVAVNGALSFVTIATGYDFTCGLSQVGAAYCWGANGSGQLGLGSTDGNPHLTPVPVQGGLAFASLTAGVSYACGLTPTGAAYCWGSNENGQLGDSSTTANSSIPVPVAGGLTFASLSAGGAHTCGLSTSGIAYCWGYNNDGSLGIGSLNRSNVPVKVAGQP